MNWHAITDDTPRDTDLLFRFNGEEEPFTRYAVGEIASDGNIYLINECFDYMFLCKLSDIADEGVKSMYYVNPKEILL